MKRGVRAFLLLVIFLTAFAARVALLTQPQALPAVAHGTQLTEAIPGHAACEIDSPKLLKGKRRLTTFVLGSHSFLVGESRPLSIIRSETIQIPLTTRLTSIRLRPDQRPPA